MEPSRNVKLKVLSYLHSPKWVEALLWMGATQVDLLLLDAAHAVWPHSDAALPEGVSFVKPGASIADYDCSVLPTGNPKEDQALAMASSALHALSVTAHLQCVLVDFGFPEETEKFKESVDIHRDLARKVGLESEVGIFHAQENTLQDMTFPTVETRTVTVKRRWPVSDSAPWLRFCNVVAETMIFLAGGEPEGSLVEVDCGDGAMLEFMRRRFGKLDCSGYAFQEAEKKAANQTTPKAAIGVYGEDDLPESETDFLVWGETTEAKLLGNLPWIERNTRKGAVVSVNKFSYNTGKAVDVFSIRRGLKDLGTAGRWRLLESNHYYLATYKATGLPEVAGE